MKVLRLITTYDCPKNCPGCCNKQEQFNPVNIPVWDRGLDDYDMIILTGGEPLMYPYSTMNIIERIRFQKPEIKIILYTAKMNDIDMIENILGHIDGITITLHDQHDVDDFRRLNFRLLSRRRWIQDNNKTLRLNIFRGVSLLLINPHPWKIKDDIVWIPDCPLPKHEVIRKW
jgi:organic radical activating enzyme